jgi:hypothetical protein
MNERHDSNVFGEMRRAVDSIAPDVEPLIAGGLQRGRRFGRQAQLRKRALTIGGPALVAAAVAGAVIVTANLGTQGSVPGAVAPGGPGYHTSSSAPPTSRTSSVPDPATPSGPVTMPPSALPVPGRGSSELTPSEPAPIATTVAPSSAEPLTFAPLTPSSTPRSQRSLPAPQEPTTSASTWTESATPSAGPPPSRGATPEEPTSAEYVTSVEPEPTTPQPLTFAPDVPTTTVYPTPAGDPRSVATGSTPADSGASKAAVSLLRSLLPKGATVTGQQRVSGDPGEVTVLLDYSQHGAAGTLMVHLSHPAAKASCSETGCTVSTLADGSRQVLSAKSGSSWNVIIDRPGGDRLQLAATGAPTEHNPVPLTRSQLVAIAQSARWLEIAY